MAVRRNIKQIFTLVNPNYSLIGIVSYTNGNQMALSINNDLGFKFHQHDSISYPPKSENPIDFPLFLYEEENNATLFKLITNRTKEGILAKEFKEFDFLLQIEGEYAQRYASRLVKVLKVNREVLASGVLPNKKLRNKLLR